jgi:hypothetical protein
VRLTAINALPRITFINFILASYKTLAPINRQHKPAFLLRLAPLDHDIDKSYREEREALVFYLRKGIEADRFHFSPRLVPVKALLAKLDAAQPRTETPEMRIAGVRWALKHGGRSINRRAQAAQKAQNFSYLPVF